jgi:hypothetical protein
MPSGKVAIKWPTPGMYWLNVTPTAPRAEAKVREAARAVEGGEGPAPDGGPAAAARAVPRRCRARPQPRRVSYVTTLEVLAP